jgi:transposase
LTPLQKYEIWLPLVRGETTISEAADRFGVDRSTIMRLRTVAKDGALQALAESKPGVQPAKRDLELEAARAEAARLGEALKELTVRLVLVEGNRRWGCVAGSRPVWIRPPSPGCWTCSSRPPGPGGRSAPPAGRWSSVRCGPSGGWGRRAADELEDQPPDGSPLHGLLDWEVAEIVRLFEQWGEVDRSHRKLAHRGS